MRKVFNERGSKVTINGHEATRTRHAGSPAAKRSARTIKREDQFDTVVQMTSERVSQPDIARALGVTQGRVSQILRAAREMTLPYRMRAIEDARAMALMETNHYAAAWAKRAKTSPRAAEVMLSWLGRADKIQGLYQQHTSLSLDSTRSTDDPPVNWANLDEQELRQFEYLNLKLRGIAPEPEPVHEVVIANWTKPAPTPPPAQIEDQSSIVAVVEDSSLSAQVTQLHAQGLGAHEIAERLRMTLAELLIALAPKELRQ